jgi:hypothetical protein
VNAITLRMSAANLLAATGCQSRATSRPPIRQLRGRGTKGLPASLKTIGAARALVDSRPAISCS